MCTKSPVREIATIEGTSIHQKTDKLSQPMGKWAFSNFVQYETHLDYDTYFPPLLVIVIFPWWIKDQIKNRQNVCVPLACTCPNLLPDGPVLWNECVMLRFSFSPTHTTHWNWRIGHCGWWCCARLRLGTGWCCFGSQWWETQGPGVWTTRSQSWLLVTSLTLMGRIRGPGWKKK